MKGYCGDCENWSSMMGCLAGVEDVDENDVGCEMFAEATEGEDE
jgi:hypothetical protein